LTHAKILVTQIPIYFFHVYNLSDVTEMQEGQVRVRYKTVIIVECPFCRYTWTPFVARPRECPSCRRRLPWNREGG